MRRILLLLLISSLQLMAWAQPVIPNRVAYWNMNGNFNDVGGNGINGTNIGGTATTNKFGQANSAMNFVNTDPLAATAYATYPINANLSFTGTQNFSISMMVFISNMGHTVSLLDNNINYGGYGIFCWVISGVPQLQFNYRGASIAFSPMPIAQWVHLGLIRENGALKIFVNGVLKSTGPESNIAQTYNFPGRFGAFFYALQTPSNYNGMQGKLDEISVYNRALTSAEMLQLANALLPMKLGDLTAVYRNNSVQLNWQTFTESQSRNFVIERSTDGQQFAAVGEVAAAGQSAFTRDYSFTDAQPLRTTAFYRLRMNDLDGTSSVSRVIVVKPDSRITGIKVFPNPVTDNIQFQIAATSSEKAKVEVIDLTGRILYSQFITVREGTQTVSLPVLNLSKGMYQLRVVREGRVEVVGVVKE